MSLSLVLRVMGASHIALGLGHVLIWRLFGWSREIAGLTPLTARVFAVHTFFISFVLVALGGLALGHPELLLGPSELSRLLLGAAALFWLLRLIAQPLVFDPFLLRGSIYRAPVRGAAMLLFGAYVLVYGWAFARYMR